MAFVHGKGTVVTVDSNALTSYISDSTFSQSVDAHDVTAYGATNKAYIDGLIDGTFSIEGHYDDTKTTGPRDVLQGLEGGGAITVVRQPEGAGTGKAQDSFSAILTAYDESSPVDDKISWSAEFQITGAVTSTVQA